MKYIFKVDRFIPCAYNSAGDKGYTVWLLPTGDQDVSGITIYCKGEIDDRWPLGQEYELTLEKKLVPPEPAKEPEKKEEEFDPWKPEANGS